MNKRLLNEFLSLPLNSDETWQGGGVPMADVLGDPLPDAAELAMVVWRSTSTDLVHAKPTALGESDLDGLMEVMLEFWSMHEFPFRPARIECNDRELAGELSDVLLDHGASLRRIGKLLHTSPRYAPKSREECGLATGETRCGRCNRCELASRQIAGGGGDLRALRTFVWRSLPLNSHRQVFTENSLFQQHQLVS